MEETKERTELHKKKRAYRFNAIDLLVLLLVILSVVSLFFRGKIERMLNEFVAGDSATVQFVIRDITDSEAAAFNMDQQFEYENGSFGTVVSYEVRDEQTVVVNSSTSEDGMTMVEFVKTEDINMNMIVGSAVVYGVADETGFYIGGSDKIAVGMTFTVSAPTGVYEFIIVGIG